MSAYTDEILPRALLLYNSPNPAIIENAIGTLVCFSQALDQRAQLASLGTLKHAVNSLRAEADENDVPGMNHPKVSFSQF